MTTTPTGGPPQKSRMVAGLLAILLNGLGAHQFYLGNTKGGFIRLGVSVITCGLGGIWSIYEGVLIFTKKINTDFNGVPLKD